MIFAEKLIKLRKQNGWSQEDLAMHIGVSRQSVSKWESMASIPDLDKIIKLSELFGVSIDYLLKDELEQVEGDLCLASELNNDACMKRNVTLEEATRFMKETENTAWKTALGVAMCIVSPVILLMLAAGGRQGNLAG